MPDGDVFSRLGRKGFKSISHSVFTTERLSEGSLRFILRTFVTPLRDQIVELVEGGGQSVDWVDAPTHFDEIRMCLRALQRSSDFGKLGTKNQFGRVISCWIRESCNEPALLAALQETPRIGKDGFEKYHQAWNRLEANLSYGTFLYDLVFAESISEAGTLAERTTLELEPWIVRPNATQELLLVDLLQPTWGAMQIE